MTEARTSITSRIVEAFLRGNLSPLFVLISLVAGVIALRVTPREEEPQIIVPVADVLLEVPGASAEEVERLVVTRLEKLLYQIDGVEYVYSVSRPDRAAVTVRFYVGEDREDSLVKLHNKLQMNLDQIPPQVASWVVRPVEVDDVAILAITLYSSEHDDFALRRVAEELERHIQAVPDTGRTEVLGGRPRRIRIEVDPELLAGRGLGLEALRLALRGAAVDVPAGAFDRRGSHVPVKPGSGPRGADDLSELVVGVHRGRPVYLREVAEILDGPAERTSYTRIGFGPAAPGDIGSGLVDPASDWPAVTLAIAKRKGSNAVRVSREVQRRIGELRGTLIPDGIEVHVTRDHGQTADDKVNELLEGLGVAIAIVVLLLAVSLGWREAFVVATAVPITFSLTLLVNHLAGYSINRVTLFALILSLGLVVDDPIVDVENIYRHLRTGIEKPFQAVLNAVNEVRPPIILATLAVIVSFIPLFFITGMMGPYMAPMALNVPLAMFSSLVVAFTVTPWLSYLALKGKARQSTASRGNEGIQRLYRRTMTPLLRTRMWRWSLLLVTAALFVASCWLALGRHVPLKMLPFDNKNELQVVVDMPEGTTLERTEAVAAEIAARLRGVAEVRDVTSYVGTSSPMDFNGMVRQYYLRRGPHVADLRVNLLHKKERSAQSHAIALRLRRELDPIARRHGANIKVVEPPPGPPVTETITIEVYGEPRLPYSVLTGSALRIAERLRIEDGVVEIDDTVEARHTKLAFALDREKAALHGLDDRDIASQLHTAVEGLPVLALHTESEVNPLVAEIRVPRSLRSSRIDLEQLPVSTADGATVRLREIGSFVSVDEEQGIYHKNLRRVCYVFAQVAGRAPAEVILDLQADFLGPGAEPPGTGRSVPVSQRTYLQSGAGLPWSIPAGTELVWNGEGEWKITLDAFRDLGLAFLGACLGIYILLVHETKSYVMPLVLMLSIPFTILGIMPGFGLLNALGSDRMPTFFTATAMIGMIALAGIAVRNAILLIEFVRNAERKGLPTHEAVLQAGAVRLRPIFLTAGTAMLAAIPITLDPIFSGLAWALIFGLFASSLFTLVLVPMVYYMVYGRRRASLDQRVQLPPGSGDQHDVVR